MSHTLCCSWEGCLSLAYLAVQRTGIVILTMGISLIVFCTVTTVRSVLPMVAAQGSLSFVLLYALCCVVSFGILFNYIAVACIAGPNVNPEETKRLALEAEALPFDKRCRLLDVTQRYCHTCERYKAPREHHCRVCGRCIPRRDHHCPWINNCVQAENNRYFVLMLLNLLFGAGFVTLLLSVVCIRLMLYGPSAITHDVRFFEPRQPCENGIFSSRTFLLFGLCATTFLTLFFLATATVDKVLRNETAVESLVVGEKERFFRGKLLHFHNPYDLGRERNAVALLETKGDPVIQYLRSGGRLSNIWVVVWLLLPTLRPSAMDGVHYSLFDDVVQAV